MCGRMNQNKQRVIEKEVRVVLFVGREVVPKKE